MSKFTLLQANGHPMCRTYKSFGFDSLEEASEFASVNREYVGPSLETKIVETAALEDQEATNLPDLDLSKK